MEVRARIKQCNSWVRVYDTEHCFMVKKTTKCKSRYSKLWYPKPFLRSYQPRMKTLLVFFAVKLLSASTLSFLQSFMRLGRQTQAPFYTDLIIAAASKISGSLYMCNTEKKQRPPKLLVRDILDKLRRWLIWCVTLWTVRFYLPCFYWLSNIQVYKYVLKLFIILYT